VGEEIKRPILETEEEGEEFRRRPLLAALKGRKKTVIYRPCCSSEVHRFPLTALQFLLQCARPHATSPGRLQFRCPWRGRRPGHHTRNAPRRPTRPPGGSRRGALHWVEEHIRTCAWLLSLALGNCLTGLNQDFRSALLILK
jgi:hypothetical protein